MATSADQIHVDLQTQKRTPKQSYRNPIALVVPFAPFRGFAAGTVAVAGQGLLARFHRQQI